MDPFDALAHTWPAAETRRVGPWLARRGEGGGKRVSCATLDGPFDGTAALAAVMRDWGQPCLVMVRAGEDELDAALAAEGYAVADPSLMLVGPAEAIAGGPAPEEAIDCQAPLACMAALWQEAGIGPGRRAVMDRARSPKAWLLGRSDQTLGAAAFVGLHGGVVMIHALAVLPACRRRGLGAILTRAAAAWGAERGASTLALAVAGDNAPARALYAGLGMREAARYHYRIDR
ncbi:N-acetyltransferase [Amaricoccus sp.]|uniref:GNAT family N-acetyltransferase n=1 Tax=Amaricoccus sp. TaxID=1872485 RepID=UPI001B6FEDE2|nr:GNAT family N-acetyltransferase [Amaricoccus sp.]MBP7000581.1 GNAT family N-acetyltransferase [Amaricoccus sp.]